MLPNDIPLRIFGNKKPPLFNQLCYFALVTDAFSVWKSFSSELEHQTFHLIFYTSTVLNQTLIGLDIFEILTSLKEKFKSSNPDHPKKQIFSLSDFPSSCLRNFNSKSFNYIFSPQ